MYWEDDSDLGSEVVRDSLSCCDFEKIKKYLHLSVNTKLGSVNFSKVLPLYDAVNKSLKQFSFLNNLLSVAEHMPPYFILHSAKQTEPEKNR